MQSDNIFILTGAVAVCTQNIDVCTSRADRSA
jgi:hypothetical protein